MADSSARSGTGQRCAAGVAKQVQHLDRAACRTDLSGVPGPVDSLLREHAGVLEAGGADDEGQLVLALTAGDLPLFRQTAAVLPLTAALIGAVVDGIGLGPERALLLGFPHHLRVGPDEDGLSPALQAVAAGGIQQLVIFPTICRAHKRPPFSLQTAQNRLCWPLSSGLPVSGAFRPRCS